MSGFGAQDQDAAPRWMLAVFVFSAVVGVMAALWIFGALT